MSVRVLFASILGATLLVCFALVAALLYRGAVHQAESETMREARVILATANAAQHYNEGHVTPLLADQPGPFHAEAIPFFATKSIMAGFAAVFPEYSYRATALNPTNPDDFPRRWQTDLIEAFRAQPALAELSGEIEDDNHVRQLYIAQPIKITDPRCLSCHSDPKNAPPAMLTAYKGNGGFGWKQGEIVGASFVTVPTAERRQVVLANLSWYLIALACVLVVGVAVAFLLLHRLVSGQAQLLVAQADRLSAGDPGAPELSEDGPAEFRMLARAINRLHRSLAAVMAELSDKP